MRHSSKALRRVLTASVVAVLLVGTAVAAGTVTKRTIEANYMDIKLVIDGQEYTPRDAAGNVIEPFASNGTTYLPVRAVAEALGKDVQWDGTTNTIYIGDTAHLPYQVNNADLYDGSNANASFTVAGKTYNLGVVLRSFHRGNMEADYVKTGSAIWNTDGYQTMTFTVGHVGDLQRNAVLYIALDGRAAGEYTLRWDGSPQTITVPLGGSPNVKLTLIADESTEPWYTWNPTEPLEETYAVYDVNLT